MTCQEVVDEITNKRQLRRLVVLPYDLIIKPVFPENVKVVTDFSKKTGDYPSLSATDIKVMALTYQLEKELIGIEHLRTEPIVKKEVNVYTKSNNAVEVNPDVTGFHFPGKKPVEVKTEDQQTTNEENVEQKDEVENKNLDKELSEKFETLQCNVNEAKEDDYEEVLAPVKDDDDEEEEIDSNEEDDDDEGWITPSNVKAAKRQVNSDLMEEKHVKVACITTDFAMQNVLKQMNLNVSALDGRMIKQLKTYILRCYACFKTTSVMTKKFCPKCGNNTLKRVAVSLDENGKLKIHINARHPLTARGKKFSLPKIQGGKHSNNPILVEDQPMPDQKPSRLARTKNNPLNDDYIAGVFLFFVSNTFVQMFLFVTGFSPFVMRDVNSKSAMLAIRPGGEMKHWMRKNPNESHKRKK